MRLNKLFFGLSLGAMSLGAISGCSYMSHDKNMGMMHQHKHMHKNKSLFVLTAREADITKADKDAYKLELSNTVDQVLWFSDRPERKAGHVDVKEMVSNWNNIFHKEDPNAALTHISLEGKDDSGVTKGNAMELSNPRFEGANLVFDVVLLKGDHVDIGKLHNVSLFIDDGSIESLYAKSQAQSIYDDLEKSLSNGESSKEAGVKFIQDLLGGASNTLNVGDGVNGCSRQINHILDRADDAYDIRFQDSKMRNIQDVLYQASSQVADAMNSTNSTFNVFGHTFNNSISCKKDDTMEQGDVVAGIMMQVLDTFIDVNQK